MPYITESLKNYFILLAFFLLIEMLIYFSCRRKGIPVSKSFLLGWQVFACLMTAIFTITGIAGLDDLLRYGTAMVNPEQINLIPFHWYADNFYNLIMNVILFLPIGLILPLLWKSGTSFGKTVCSGFFLSLLIEISQLFSYRATDIDDLLMNTLGTVIGYTFYFIFLRKYCVFQTDNRSRSLLSRNSALGHILVIFLFYFCIGGPFLNFIYRIIR